MTRRTTPSKLRFTLISACLVATLGLMATARAEVTPRIIGGTPVDNPSSVFETIPWQVAIVVSNGTQYSNPFCGGTLLNERWVVTAAHCAGDNAEDTDDTYVIVGHPDMNNVLQRNLIEIRRWIIHPNYGRFNAFDSDIALLQLVDAVDLAGCGEQCEPLGLVEPAAEPFVIPNGAEVLISGWGDTEAAENIDVYSDILQYAWVNITTCPSNDDISSNMICAIAPDFSRDSCVGDSGGPLVAESNDGSGNMLLAGITSFGFTNDELECAVPGATGVYTRVANFKAWIDTTIANCCSDDRRPLSGSSKGGGGFLGAMEWWVLAGLAGIWWRRKKFRFVHSGRK